MFLLFFINDEKSYDKFIPFKFSFLEFSFFLFFEFSFSEFSKDIFLGYVISNVVESVVDVDDVEF